MRGPWRLLWVSVALASLLRAPGGSAAAGWSGAPVPESAESALAPLAEAYRLLLDRHVEPVAPGTLAAAAVQGMAALASARGGAGVDPHATATADDREASWQQVVLYLQTLARDAAAPLPPRELAYWAIAAMAGCIDDDHTRFLHPEEYALLSQPGRDDARYAEVGLRVPLLESHRQGDLGYLILRAFSESQLATAAAQSARELQAQGVRGLILDLRGNSGGRLDVGVQLLDALLGEGPLYQLVDRDGQVHVTSTVGGPLPLLQVPLVVLVDADTTSMGELFAAIVQERGAGHVVGAPTAGRVVASQVLPLGDGSALQVSTGRLLTAGGRSLVRTGLVPDLLVANPPGALLADDDPAFAAARAYLHAVAADEFPTVPAAQPQRERRGRPARTDSVAQPAD